MPQGESRVPNQIGRYQVLARLGQGGMGSVYHAYDPELERDVVAKFITITAQADAQWRERFRQEVRAASQLNHPHIITVYDVDLEHNPPYVVMERLQGGTLEERLRAEPLAWQDALSLFRLLAQTLGYAHQAGIIHRDVKPANVMFAGQEFDTVKLVDFGLARREGGEALTQVGDVLGSLAYMSPEQARGEVVDGRTDIFSLGIVLFEAITGYNPLDKGSTLLTLNETISGERIDSSPLTGKAPLDVIQVIKGAVDKNREARYPTCEALLADLDRCLERVSGVSTIRLAPTSTARRAARNPTIRLGGNIRLTPEIETVLKSMFSTFSQVAVEAEFSRGFSGSRVFQIRLTEPGGKTHLPAVVKIAPLGLIQREWAAYQSWVENTLPNIAQLQGRPILPAESLWGGLRYSLVGGGTFAVQSLHDYYQTAEIDELCAVLENRLFAIMGQNWWLDNRAQRSFQMQTDYDRLLPVNLLIKPLDSPPPDEARLIEPGKTLPLIDIDAGQRVQISGYIITEVDPERGQVTLNLPPAPPGQLPASYRLRLDNVPDVARYRAGHIIDSLHGEVIATRHSLLLDHARRAVGQTVDVAAERLALPDGSSLPNPLLRYQTLLQDFLTVKISTLHGDLNLENILIDPATREVSLIDFATVCQGHALRDLLRLETEVVIMLLPPLLARAGLSPGAIYSLYEQLHQVILYPDRPLNLPIPTLAKPFRMLQAIRKMARKCLFDPDDWREYYQGLSLYLLGALKIKRLARLPTAPLPGQVAFWGAAAAQQLLEDPPTRQSQAWERPPRLSSAPTPEPSTEIESPYGTMHPTSPFYVERAGDEICWQAISRGQAVTLFIQAPRQMGKSSLMRRIIARAKAIHHRPAAFIDFQKFPENYFHHEENFLVELCLMIGEVLGVPEAIDRYWGGRRTNIVKCSRYISDHIVPQVGQPFILAMDEVERMLTSPFSANFFGMLRTWHNDRAHDERFAWMSLFLSSSTEPYLFIDNPNQSPFNVAEIISLRDFSQAEVEELNRRHQSPLSGDQVSDLMSLLNGHPFLTRSALYQLAAGKTDWETLMAAAAADAGPFGDHLRHYLLRVLNQPELKRALTEICAHHTYPENQTFHRLKGAGLVKQEGSRVILRNTLYARYFEEHLNG